MSDPQVDKRAALGLAVFALTHYAILAGPGYFDAYALKDAMTRAERQAGFFMALPILILYSLWALGTHAAALSRVRRRVHAIRLRTFLFAEVSIAAVSAGATTLLAGRTQLWPGFWMVYWCIILLGPASITLATYGVMHRVRSERPGAAEAK